MNTIKPAPECLTCCAFPHLRFHNAVSGKEIVDKLKEWGLCEDREVAKEIAQYLMDNRLLRRVSSKNPLFKDRKEKFYAVVKSGST